MEWSQCKWQRPNLRILESATALDKNWHAFIYQCGLRRSRGVRLAVLSFGFALQCTKSQDRMSALGKRISRRVRAMSAYPTMDLRRLTGKCFAIRPPPGLPPQHC